MLTSREFREKLKGVKYLLLDLDGTLYQEDHLFDFTLEFLSGLDRHQIQKIYVTNNSSKGRSAYFKKLHSMGISLTEDEIYSSSDATLDYLQQRTNYRRIFLLGTPSLEAAFSAAGFTLTADAQCVVMGYDKTLTYEKINQAYHLIQSGLPFIVTHPDILCPIKDGGFDIDLGALMQPLIYATGIEPIIIGKPYAQFVDGLLNKLSKGHQEPFDLQSLAIMGDRLYTDIRTGKDNGFLSILVLTGEATREDVEPSEVVPDFILERNVDLLSYLNSE
ncbi:MAG: HAD-IIA family hydrolase [Desulfuromusa sp.]